MEDAPVGDPPQVETPPTGGSTPSPVAKVPGGSGSDSGPDTDPDPETSPPPSDPPAAPLPADDGDPPPPVQPDPGSGSESGSESGPDLEPPPEPATDPGDAAAITDSAAIKFLNRATFGATDSDLSAVQADSASDWFRRELEKPASSFQREVTQLLAADGATDPSGQPTFQGRRTPNVAFWQLAVTADDQLRQRVAYALSQIFVISNRSRSPLFDWPVGVAYYQDVLARNALGNFRTLLEEVSLSPAMAIHLTYMRNLKADAATGREPDENYARELLQLFTIGLVELKPDGTPRLANGEPVESYSNDDITGLARVFTGLSLDTDVFFYGFAEENSGAQARPLRAFPEWHSVQEKQFLGVRIPAGTDALASIRITLDALIQHPNTAPFVARQLIKRLVMSAPPPAYVARVARAFEDGLYLLPDGELAGRGERGDLAATIAAVLFDPRAVGDSGAADEQGGKLREPVLRVTQYLRLFVGSAFDSSRTPALHETTSADSLAQAPFQSPSVFNFYRPGYLAPGTRSGDLGMTVPELQIVTANSLVGYSNTLGDLIFSGGVAERWAGAGPDFSSVRGFAEQPITLVDRLAVMLGAAPVSNETRDRIVAFLQDLPAGVGENAQQRVRHAIQLLMTSPDYVAAK